VFFARLQSELATIDLIAGARPNFVKLAPVVRALVARRTLAFRLVHTGQHYDEAMNDVFFAELGIPRPEVHLEVGSASHGAQTARILERYEAELLKQRPDATVVFGDVNSTAACALAATKLGVQVAHVEAGLRSFDRSMPEEINRIVTDSIADLLLTSEPSGETNLRREGVPAKRIRFVGNVMIDTLLAQLPIARCRPVARQLGVAGRRYGLVTMHRPSNVDDPAVLRVLVELLDALAHELPLVFPIHPRTLNAARNAGLDDLVRPGGPRLICVPPLSYLDNLSLLAGAAVALTDSGGLQEETSVLGVPCLTLRDTTERPVTLDLGTSRLVGNDPAAIRAAFDDAIGGNWPTGQPIPLWDGQTASRIVSELTAWLS
jgi:UDP-N-acetylglucosamine 2-epimerase (non-hydrolysing)